MQTLSVPRHYETWLTSLKDYMERTPGSKTALAKHLAARGRPLSSCRVSVSKLLAGDLPAADRFLDYAAWLQDRTEESPVTDAALRLVRAIEQSGEED